MNKSVIAEATNVNTAPDRLRELASDLDCNLEKYLVSNPNTPIDVLFKLGEKYPKELLANPVLGLYLLSNLKLLADMPTNTFANILKLPEVPQEFILFALNNRPEASILFSIIYGRGDNQPVWMIYLFVPHLKIEQLLKAQIFLWAKYFSLSFQLSLFVVFAHFTLTVTTLIDNLETN